MPDAAEATREWRECVFEDVEGTRNFKIRRTWPGSSEVQSVGLEFIQVADVIEIEIQDGPVVFPRSD